MALPQDHIRALDQLRMRLSQLSNSFKSLQDHLTSQDPLPSWPTLQSDATTLGANLQELATVLNEQRQMFTSMHAYPLPNFPGTTQEIILQELLRKKLNPKAEAWIDESLKTEDASREVNGSANPRPFSAEQMEDLWSWAKPASREFLTPLLENGDMESDYTLAEQEAGIENVVTGIKSLDEADDEDEEMQDGEKELSATAPNAADAVQPAVPLEDILRFISGGDLAPPNR